MHKSGAVDTVEQLWQTTVSVSPLGTQPYQQV